MWEVTITDRGLGSSKKLNGQYCVGLTTDGIQLINKHTTETFDLPVSYLLLVTAPFTGMSEGWWHAAGYRCTPQDEQ